MSLDLGGPAIEIAIALAFVFFLLSLVALHVTEWFAGALNLRAKTLRKGLEGMLGDSGVVEKVLCHALVRTDLQPDRKRAPSYIAPENFALALRDVLDAPDEKEPPKVKVDDHERPVDEALATQLRVLPSGGAIPEMPELEKWFDESMKRVGGWYKRKSQLVTIAVAVLLVLALNVSTLRIAEQLNGEPKVLANVVAKAEAATEEEGPGGAGGGEPAGMKQDRGRSGKRRPRPCLPEPSGLLDRREEPPEHPRRVVDHDGRLADLDRRHLVGRPILVRRPQQALEPADGGPQAGRKSSDLAAQQPGLPL